jgi:hypothetical protein
LDGNSSVTVKLKKGTGPALILYIEGYKKCIQMFHGETSWRQATLKAEKYMVGEEYYINIDHGELCCKNTN